MPTRRFRLSLPVDVAVTLAPLRLGHRDPTIRIGPDEALRASWTPEGPATLHVRVRDREVTAEAWGAGAAWALGHAPDLLGAADDLTGFVADHHATVARCHRRRPGLRMTRTGRVADVLVQTVLEQKVTGIEAKRAWARIVAWWGQNAPGPGGLRLPVPTAELAGRPYWPFHRAGVERARATTIIEACRRIDRLEEALAMPPEAAHRRLTAVPGIGDWTAAVVRRVAFGDADAVETGDYHLPNLVAWNLAGQDRADDARMLELLQPFAGHRARTARLLLFAGSRAPRYGSRMAPGPIHQL